MNKKRFSLRLVAGTAAVCLSAAFVVPSPAGAQTPNGLGTSKASQALLDFALGKGGSLLGIKLMADSATSTIDDAVAPAHGVSSLVPLSITSEVLPAINNLTSSILNATRFESRTPGGQPEVSGSALNLASPGGVLGLPLGLLGGELVPNKLTSALDGAGARSTLDAALAKLSIVSGLLKIDSVSNKLGTAAALPNANGTRALEIGAVSLLNLGDLLKGLGLPLELLDLSIVSNLVGALGLPVALPGGSSDLLGAVNGLVADITGITGAVGGATELLDDVVSTVPQVNSLLGGLPTSLPLSGNNLVPTDVLALPTGTVQNLLNTLQGTLQNLLGTALGLLDNLTLLKLDGATVAANTKAADTLANSVADVTAKLGGLNVLGLQLPGVDLLSIGSLLNGVTTQLGNVLGIIDPSLKDLVKVGVLDKTTSLTTANGYNNALAALDVLSVSITPPALLSNLVNTLTGTLGLSALGKLSAAGVANPAGSLPLLGDGALALGNLLNLPATVGALTQGLSLKIGSVQSASQFKLASAPAPAAVAAPVPQDTLPRTGGDTRTLGILAAGMAMLALGVRRWARRPELD